MNDYYMANWRQAAPHRRRLAARPGRHDALLARPWKVLASAFVDSVMTLIAFLPVLVRAVGQHHRTADRRRDPVSAGRRGDRLVDLRHGRCSPWSASSCRACEFRNQRVEAAYRKELVYGEDDADRAQPPTVAELFAQCAPQLFPALFPLRLFQRRPATSTCRPTTSSRCIMLGADDRRRQDHARRLNQIISRLRAGVRLVPVPGQFVADDRRADLDLQAPARLRGDAGRRAAAGASIGAFWSAPGREA